MNKTVFALVAMLAALTSQAQTTAADPAKAMRLMAGLGVTGGGDNLASVVYTNGSHQNINAGSGVFFSGGVDYRINTQFSVQGTVNFHVDDTNANNGSVKFQRFPVELLSYYHLNADWRIGGGVRYVSSPKLSSSGVAAGMNTTFDDTTSGVVEAEYFWNPKVGIKMRYVNETLKPRGFREIKANHVGLSGNVYF